MSSRLAHAAYSLLWIALLPLVLLTVLLLRRDLLPELPQRFGFRLPKIPPDTVCLHAASVGEVMAAAPVVDAILANNPNQSLLFTTLTPSGAAQAQRLFAAKAQLCYLPFDLGFCVRRFLRQAQPRLLILMETELWPTLMAECRARQVPIAIISGRLSDRAFPHYLRGRSLFAEGLRGLAFLGAQTPVDAQRYTVLGVQPEHVTITGNTKLDSRPDQDQIQNGKILRQRHLAGDFVWLAASTHPGEEALMLAAHRKLQEKIPGAQMLLAPRHPQRFAAVASELGQGFIRFSDIKGSLYNESVVLVDTMGQMALFIEAADVVVMAGSFAPIGGHNPLEPIRQSRPVITGPHTQNFADVYARLADAQACVKVGDAEELARALVRMAGESGWRENLALAATNVVDEMPSPTRSTMAGIARLL